MLLAPGTRSGHDGIGVPIGTTGTERYGTHAGYVAKVKEAARRLVAQRFLLMDDADRLVHQAEASDVL